MPTIVRLQVGTAPQLPPYCACCLVRATQHVRIKAYDPTGKVKLHFPCPLCETCGKHVRATGLSFLPSLLAGLAVSPLGPLLVVTLAGQADRKPQFMALFAAFVFSVAVGFVGTLSLLTSMFARQGPACSTNRYPLSASILDGGLEVSCVSAVFARRLREHLDATPAGTPQGEWASKRLPGIGAKGWAAILVVVLTGVLGAGGWWTLQQGSQRAEERLAPVDDRLMIVDAALSQGRLQSAASSVERALTNLAAARAAIDASFSERWGPGVDARLAELDARCDAVAARVHEAQAALDALLAALPDAPQGPADLAPAAQALESLPDPVAVGTPVGDALQALVTYAEDGTWDKVLAATETLEELEVEVPEPFLGYARAQTPR